MLYWVAILAMGAGDTIVFPQGAEVQNRVIIERFPGVPKDGLTGHTSFDLDIDARGRVSGCTVRDPSGNSALDDLACRMARTLRYKPATDEKGKPTTWRDFRGVDWAVDRTLGKEEDQRPNLPANAKPVSDIPSLFGFENYPKDALEAGAEGRSVAELTIDSAGQVTDCEIAMSSGDSHAHKSLDAKTCELGRTAAFAPARDRKGRAVASHYLLPVRWTIDSEVKKFDWDTISLIVTTEWNGDRTIHSCEQKLVGSPLPFPNTTCEDIAKPTGGLHPEGSTVGGIHMIVEVRLDYPGLKAPPPVDFTSLLGVQRSQTHLHIGLDGDTSDCHVETDPDERKAAPGFCDAHLRFKPVRDEKGAPREVDATITYTRGGKPITAAPPK